MKDSKKANHDDESRQTSGYSTVLDYFTDGIRDCSVRSCCFANTLVGASNATYRRCTAS